jgi:hypothetical protein
VSPDSARITGFAQAFACEYAHHLVGGVGQGQGSTGQRAGDVRVPVVGPYQAGTGAGSGDALGRPSDDPGGAETGADLDDQQPCGEGYPAQPAGQCTGTTPIAFRTAVRGR